MNDELKEQLLPFESLDEASEFIRDNCGLYISMNLQAIGDERLTALLNLPNVFAYADGIGAQFFWKHKFNVLAAKIPGCELWLRLLALEDKQCNLAVIGASQEANSITVDKLKQDYPQHNVRYSVDGYTLDEELLLSKISSISLDYVFIALGQPKQELLAMKILEINPNLKILGLGGSFDVYAGLSKRAPEVFVRLKIEWLYRIIKQPKRSSKLLTSVYKYFLLLLRK